ncbi:MAG TPA: M56 family metallopeptidase [Bryobacteraceae bacterium]|nr:M56 family metallopeptidase [Bryobacteraceae bacterium]
MIPFHLLNSVARVTVEALFNGLWQGLVVCALAAGALACHRRCNAATRYAVWLVTLAVIAALPLLRTAPRAAAARTEHRVITMAEPSRPLAAPAMKPGGLAPPAHAVRVIPPAPSRVAAEGTRARRISSPAAVPLATIHMRNRWPAMLFCAWIAGAVLMLFRLAWSFLHVRRLRRASLPLGTEHQNRLTKWLKASGGACRVKLHSAANIRTPMALGALDPLILIPNDFLDRLTDAECDHVLLHELAHVRRGDHWTNLFQKLVEAVLFFHPAVWWTAKKLNLERESACDDWVVHVTGEPKPYAACLAKMAEVIVPASAPLPATGMFRGARQISTRIERLLERGRNRAPRASLGALIPAVMVLGGAAFVCAEVRAVLAGPDAGAHFARLQPVSWSGQNAPVTPPPQAKAQEPTSEAQGESCDCDGDDQVVESTNPAESADQIRSLAEEALELQKNLNERRLEQSADQMRAAEKLLQDLRTRDFKKQAEQAQEQFGQLWQQKALTDLMQQKNAGAYEQQLLAAQIASEKALLDAGQQWNFTQSNGFWNGLNVKTKGQIEFTDDDSDVKSVSPGGSISIEERRGWTTRKYEVTPNERRYLVNGREHAIDEEAKSWLAEVLPQVIRDSGAGASARVKRILKQHGPDGVLDEISKISSDHAKRVYFTELFASGPLPQDVLRRAARQMGREIASDGEKARLLIETAEVYLKDANSPRVEYFDAVGTIASDGDHRRVLSNALQKDGHNPETLRLALKSASRISSDGDKAHVLMEAADSPAFGEPVSADYLHAVNSIASDGDHARVLLALMRASGVSKDTLLLALKSAGRIASDGDKARVLTRAVEFYTPDAAVRSAFFNATGTVSSDGDHAGVLIALLAKNGLDKESFVEVIRSAEHIASDGEKGRVLRQVAAICPNDDVVVATLVQATQTLASDGEYRRVMSAMLNRSDLSAKIGRIKYI